MNADLNNVSAPLGIGGGAGARWVSWRKLTGAAFAVGVLVSGAAINTALGIGQTGSGVRAVPEPDHTALVILGGAVVGAMVVFRKRRQ